MTAEQWRLSMQRTYVKRTWDVIPTHYIIGSDGSFVKVNWLDVIVGATLNGDANANGIHIEMIWDSNVNYHTPKQYETLRTIVGWIKEKHPKTEIKYHKDFLQTTQDTGKQRYKNCPGKNFDYDFMSKKNISFHLSRYYSPEPWQTKYFRWSYNEDVCMNCWCAKEPDGTFIAPYDCTVPADGHKLLPTEAWKVIACPKEYKLGTKFYLEWIWVVTCRDRGWAINGNRLDLRGWYWQTAIDNWKNIPTGIRKWYVFN